MRDFEHGTAVVNGLKTQTLTGRRVCATAIGESNLVQTIVCKMLPDDSCLYRAE